MPATLPRSTPPAGPNTAPGIGPSDVSTSDPAPPRDGHPTVNNLPPTMIEKKRILVVDDRASDSRLMKLCLEQTNDYVVREENDARAALSTAEDFKPHLILLDIMMPGMGGGELAACFQASPKLGKVPIVFLTALITKKEAEANGGRIGGFPFLAKPIVLSEAIDCLRRQLSP